MSKYIWIYSTPWRGESEKLFDNVNKNAERMINIAISPEWNSFFPVIQDTEAENQDMLERKHSPEEELVVNIQKQCQQPGDSKQLIATKVRFRKR